MSPNPSLVAILATGDEITNGDILNTNAKAIANALTDLNINVGMHASAPDDDNSLTQAIRFLLNDHAVLITIGGLGPTSDDRTRFALNSILGTELIFDAQSYQKIQARLNTLNLPIPESNKQQCLFPKGATILMNSNGTANACYSQHNNQHIFMLPGPPSECLPLLQEQVIPLLKQLNLSKTRHRKHWLLLGVSEGSIAALLDKEIERHPEVSIGYRVDHPHLEIKLWSENKTALDAASNALEVHFQEKIISHEKQTAAEQVRLLLLKKNLSLQVCDQATGGLLQTQLQQPRTWQAVTFDNNEPLKNNVLGVAVDGLSSYWDTRTSATDTQLTITLTYQGSRECILKTLPCRSRRLTHYAVELICLAILNWHAKHLH